MNIILLDEQKFDEYASKHPNANFYQSSSYGKFMSKHGHNAYYLAMVDNYNQIKAATLMIVKNENNTKRKTGYSPRGFLIDWNDENLVKEFTENLKDFLSKRNFTSLKIDPKVIYKEHNFDGTTKNDSILNDSMIKRLQSLGYIHMGFNNGTEASKLRWDSKINLDSNIVNLFNSLPKNARDKIKEAANLGNKVYKGNANDINLFYSILQRKIPPIDYYMDLYQFFNDNFELYFTKLNPASYVNSSKALYEREEQKNNEINNQIQSFNTVNKEELINEKLKSDELLSKYKKNMQEAIKLFEKYPNGITNSTCIVIKFGKNASFFATAHDENGKENYSEYLLKWQIMVEYAKKGYKTIDINGMTGNFSNDYSNVLNREVSNNIVEYIGEFDLIINKKLYYSGSKLNPILNWLNTPI